MSVCICSRLFENQPNEICSHLSEKALKGRLFGPDELQNHTNKRKGKEKKKERGGRKKGKRKKSNGCILSVHNGFSGDLVFG